MDAKNVNRNQPGRVSELRDRYNNLQTTSTQQQSEMQTGNPTKSAGRLAIHLGNYKKNLCFLNYADNFKAYNLE